MGLFDDILADDARLFCDPELMPGGASIIYTPYGASPKTINANVFRLGPQLVGGLDGVIAPSLEIFVQNHATRGVTSININGDRVTLPERQGETAKTFTVNEILDQDAGGWRLRLT